MYQGNAPHGRLYSILLLLSIHSFALHTVGRFRADVSLDTSNLLLANDAVRDLVHGLERLPVADLFVEELVEIQSQHLSFLADTQVHAGNVLEGEQQDTRHNERVGRDGGDFGELLANLHAVSVDTTGGQGGTVESADLLVGKDAGEEGSHHATNSMKLEDVKAFVDVQPVVEILEGCAGDSCDEADDCGEPDRNIASGGRDANQASNGTFAGTDHGETSLSADVVNKNPADSASRGSDVGVEGGVPNCCVSC